MAPVGNVNERLDRHIVLDLECLDRIYLNAYVPRLQVGGPEDVDNQIGLLSRLSNPTTPSVSRPNPIEAGRRRLPAVDLFWLGAHDRTTRRLSRH